MPGFLFATAEQGLLKEVFPIEERDLHPEWIECIDTSQVYAQLARETRSFVKRIDAASLAEIVLRGFIAELVAGQRIITDLGVQCLPVNDVR
jgi:hypothetical protein